MYCSYYVECVQMSHCNQTEFVSLQGETGEAGNPGPPGEPGPVVSICFVLCDFMSAYQAYLPCM